jgi:hypothetical protein
MAAYLTALGKVSKKWILDDTNQTKTFLKR